MTLRTSVYGWVYKQGEADIVSAKTRRSLCPKRAPKIRKEVLLRMADLLPHHASEPRNTDVNMRRPDSSRLQISMLVRVLHTHCSNMHTSVLGAVTLP